MIITNSEVKDLKLLQNAFSLKEKRDVLIKKAKSKDEVNISKLAEKNAKQALTQKLYQTESNNNLIESLANKFDLNNNINLIEVYDNSHNQGSDSIGALICFGNEGFIKTSFLTQFYENKVVPSMIITNTEVKDLKLLQNAFSLKEKRNVLIKKAKMK